MRRLIGSLLLVIAVAAVAAALPSAAQARPGLQAYRGLGVWIDIYDSGLWGNPAATVASCAAHGVRTIYIETANYHAKSAIFSATDLSELIEAAHARKIKVVAWYLPGLQNLSLDYSRSLAAINFRTPGGQKFDSFGLDIEDSTVQPASKRSSRLLTLSSRLRTAVGASYPMAAITPSPYGIRLRPTYWPGFPYKSLMKIYDVILPMGYFTYHGDGVSQAYKESCENVHIVREECGPNVPIHLIGGVGDKITGAEARSFVRAVREHGLLGGSMYDMSTTSADTWRQLELIPANPIERPVLPASLPLTKALGNIPRADRSHPKEVFVQTGALPSASKVRVRLFDVQAREVRLLVNWVDVGPVPAGPAHGWSRLRTLSIPARALHTKGTNLIAFVAKGSYPKWHEWGVRDLSVGP